MDFGARKTQADRQTCSYFSHASFCMILVAATALVFTLFQRKSAAMILFNLLAAQNKNRDGKDIGLSSSVSRLHYLPKMVHTLLTSHRKAETESSHSLTNNFSNLIIPNNIIWNHHHHHHWTVFNSVTIERYHWTFCRRRKQQKFRGKRENLVRLKNEWRAWLKNLFSFLVFVKIG